MDSGPAVAWLRQAQTKAARVAALHFGVQNGTRHGNCFIRVMQASIVCVVDGGKLVDSPTLAELVRADPQASLSSLAEDTCPTVTVDAEVPEVARVMSDYNLIAIPVLDGEGIVAGIIAVDDVLELLIPEEWRWRAGAGDFDCTLAAEQIAAGS